MTPEFDFFRRLIELDDATLVALRKLGPCLVPHAGDVVEAFYDRMLRSPEAMARFPGGEAQVTRQQVFLHRWIEAVFAGEVDEEYVERQQAIGRVHLTTGVDEVMMIASMNWIRADLTALIRRTRLPDGLTIDQSIDAVNRWLDMSLGLILMAYWKDLHGRLTRVDRLALIGQFAASINHELRNPLGVIGTSLYLLRERLDGAEPYVVKHLLKIERNLSRATAIIDGMLRLIRVEEPARDVVDIPALIQEIIDSLPGRGEVAVEVGGDGETQCVLDRDQVRQALENVLRNAYEALDGKGKIRVEWNCDQLATVFRIADDGPGIPPESVRRILEPLYSTKSFGTGLGLTLAKAVAEAHGGSLEIGEGLDGRGASFEIRFPASA